MLDETQESPSAESEDDAVDVAEVSDAGGDDAVDLAELGGEVETADEPQVSPEELMDIPGEPREPGAEKLTEARAREASELGAKAAQAQAGGGAGNRVEGEPTTGNTGDV